MEARAARGAEGVATAAPGEGWRLEGDLGLDGAWTLDPYLDQEIGVTATGDLLERSWVRPMSRPTAALGVRMASLLSARTWPADLVVVPVPSSNDAADVLARVVALVLEREPQRLLVARRGMRTAAPEHRYRLARRRAPDHVLLVDDVVRTGNSLRACADLLRDHGAVGVWAVTAAAELVPADRRVGRRSAGGGLDLPDMMLARVDALRPVTSGRRVDVTEPVSIEVAQRVPLFDQESPALDASADDQQVTVAQPDHESTPVADPEPADVEIADVETADVETADVEIADVETADVETADVETADVEIAGVLDDEELMAAVGRAFEAIAGLEALQKIVDQVSPEESLSIEGLLSELLAVAADAEIDADDGEDVQAIDAADPSADAADVADVADVADAAGEDVDATVEVDESEPTGVDGETEDGETEDEQQAVPATAPATQGSGWRGRRRRQKPKPSTMR